MITKLFELVRERSLLSVSSQQNWVSRRFFYDFILTTYSFVRLLEFDKVLTSSNANLFWISMNFFYFYDRNCRTKKLEDETTSVHIVFSKIWSFLCWESFWVYRKAKCSCSNNKISREKEEKSTQIERVCTKRNESNRKRKEKDFQELINEKTNTIEWWYLQ